MLSNQRLKEIGTNPSSPKALSDLLMQWVRLGASVWNSELLDHLILFDRLVNLKRHIRHFASDTV